MLGRCYSALPPEKDVPQQARADIDCADVVLSLFVEGSAVHRRVP